MDLQGASVMILGGSGLVGRAVARRLLAFRPGRIVLVALGARETEEAADALAPLAGDTVIAVESGNIYAGAAPAGGDRGAEAAGAALRRLVDDIFGDLTEDVLKRSFLV